MKSLLTFFFVAFLTLCLLYDQKTVEAGEIAVRGVGYPPVRAVNKTQALLMAKRAAVLDAYANALQRNAAYSQNKPGQDDTAFYHQIAGFLKGMVIAKEEYLSDGSVLVELRGAIDISDKQAVTPATIDEKSNTAPQSGPLAPQPVTLMEWSEIIEKMVLFSSKQKEVEDVQ